MFFSDKQCFHGTIIIPPQQVLPCAPPSPPPITGVHFTCSPQAILSARTKQLNCEKVFIPLNSKNICIKHQITFYETVLSRKPCINATLCHLKLDGDGKFLKVK